MVLQVFASAAWSFLPRQVSNKYLRHGSPSRQVFSMSKRFASTSNKLAHLALIIAFNERSFSSILNKSAFRHIALDNSQINNDFSLFIRRLSSGSAY